MEPTARDRVHAAQEQGEIPFPKNPDQSGESGQRVSPEPNVPAEPVSDYATTAVPAQPAPASPPHLWLQRVWLVIYVVFCIELGIVMAALPWTQFWNSNSLLASLPTLRQVLHNNFVRGAISGLGVIDIWLGIWEAVHYRERRKAQPPADAS